jgi:hypothetical protein
METDFDRIAMAALDGVVKATLSEFLVNLSRPTLKRPRTPAGTMPSSVRISGNSITRGEA